VNRYVVLDTEWVSAKAISVGRWRGEVLDSFFSLDSARALALHRMAYGDIGVVVIDQLSGEKVFPLSDVRMDHEEKHCSGVRLMETALCSAQARRAKKVI
jgi:hypothetical protein